MPKIIRHIKLEGSQRESIPLSLSAEIIDVFAEDGHLKVAVFVNDYETQEGEFTFCTLEEGDVVPVNAHRIGAVLSPMYRMKHVFLIT